MIRTIENTSRYTLALNTCKALVEEGYRYIVEKYIFAEQSTGYPMDGADMTIDSIICDTKKEADNKQHENSINGCPSYIFSLTELIQGKEKEEEQIQQRAIENNKKQELKERKKQQTLAKEKEKAEKLNLTVEEYRRRKRIERKISTLKKEIAKLEAELNQG